MLETLKTINSDHLLLFAGIIAGLTCLVLYRLGYLSAPRAALRPQWPALPAAPTTKPLPPLNMTEPLSTAAMADAHRASAEALAKRVDQLKGDLERAQAALASGKT